MMATADQLERQAAQAAARAQADYLARIRAGSAAGNRISPDTAVAGAQAAGRVASGQGATMSQKPFEAMTKQEQMAALSKVDWNSPFFQQGKKDEGSKVVTTKTEETPKTIMPVATPSGGGGNGGNGGSGGGDGGGERTETSNVDAIAKMYAEALAELQRQYGVSQENINAAIGRMRSDPYNTANAYAQMQLADPRVAANPVAEYMAAAGMAPGQAAAAQQMAQAEADAYLRAMENVRDIMSTSQEQANLSRLADIGLIETGATQDLESNLNMLRLGLEKERIGALTGQQQQNLQTDIAMRNAITTAISNIFSGQDVAPESILKLIESALAKINTNRWTTLPTYTTGV
jgi:hypothetical protein